MKRKKKNVTLISMITANIVAILLFVFVFTTYTNSESVNTNEENEYDYFENFGRYGILCRDLEQNHDLHTNFAIRNYVRRSETTYNVYKEDGSIENDLVREKNNEKGIQDALYKFRDYCNDFLYNTRIEDIGTNKEINIENREEDFIYFFIDDSLNNVKLKMRPDQTVVFGTDSYNVTIDSVTFEGASPNNVFFLIVRNGNVYLNSENIFATIIAPAANVYVNQSGCGWIVGSYVCCNSDWHVPHFGSITLPTPIPKSTPTPTPTPTPTTTPTPTPTGWPMPSEEPTPSPSEEPTPSPSEEPTPSPSEEPTPSPSEEPSPSPSEEPTPSPSEEPTPSPSEEPSPSPSEEPTPSPSEEPTPSPSEEPMPSPSEEPTPTPTSTPTSTPTPSSIEALNVDPSPFTSDELSQSKDTSKSENKYVGESDIENNAKTGDNIIKFIVILIISIGAFLGIIYRSKKFYKKK